MELAVLNTSGKETGRVVTLSEAIFGIEPNDHAIYLDVKQYLSNQRQGTHKSKQRNEVSGSTKKLKKQKGTGGARAGSIKNPQFKGGGRIFGPVPRDYSFKLNKKLKQLARRSALSYKAKDASITVLENISFDAPKTKEYIKLLSALSVADKKTLLVVPTHSPNVYLSSRNIQNAKVVTADSLNTYDILHAQNLILCEGSVEKINELLAN
ncbi:MAG: 50S ribosomal protein L4 [Thermoflexibacter sp.]